MHLKIQIYLFLFGFTIANAQEQSEKNLQQWFDTKFAKQNLDINNGLMKMDTYLVADKSNQFYKDDVYVLGEVKFDNQVYPELYINYDIYTDELLIKPNGASDLRAVNCIKNKTEYFILANKKFVNLDYQKNVKNELVSGYYEQDLIGTKIVLYTKNQKTRLESIKDMKVYSNFILNNQFILYYNQSFQNINQSVLKSTFPEYKTEIDNYYSENYKLQKSNEKQFLENLLATINAKLNKF